MALRERAKAALRVSRVFEELDAVDQRELAADVFRSFGDPTDIIREYERTRKSDQRLSRTIQRPVPDKESIMSRTHVPDNQTERTKVLSSSGYSPGFCSFWSLYPKRVGKKEAYRAWNKGNCESISEAVVQAVREQNGYLVRERGKFTPLPATWLNQGRWEDSPSMPKSQAQELWEQGEAQERQGAKP